MSKELRTLFSVHSLACSIVVMACCAGPNVAGQTAKPLGNTPVSNPAVAQSYGKLPLSFEVNKGQTDKSVRFTARGQGYGIFLTDEGAVLSLSKPAAGKGELKPDRLKGIRQHPQAQLADVVRMELIGAHSAIPVTSEDPLPGTVNYFIGNDPAKWRSHVQTYAKVKYAGVYPGVDLVYYGNQQQLEYDFVVAPGANAKPIRLHFDGAKRLKLDADGNLGVIGQHGEVAFRKPIVYQQRGDQRQPVEGSFTLIAGNKVSFRLGSYDRSLPLVIDPVLTYSTYLGGSFADSVRGIAVDASGDAFAAGTSYSPDFPVTSGAFQTTNNSAATGNGTAFVAKLNPKGSALLYATYLGGDNMEEGLAIAVNNSGNAYVAGESYSADFPVTPGAYQTVNNAAASASQNVFVTELNGDGTALIYSTLIGGAGPDFPTGIALDGAGNAYITGDTSNTSGFPVTQGAFQTANNSPTYTCFATKLNATGTALDYSTLLGGTADTNANAIAINSAGNAFVAGLTDASDFPVTPGAFQTTNPNTPKVNGTGFVTEFNETGTALVYSTYLGGSLFDNANSIAVDGSGSAYVVGDTQSPDFPVTPGAFRSTGSTNSSGISGFITKLNPAGTGLVYSTYLSGSNGTSIAQAIALDDSGDANVAILTTATDFPVTSNASQSTNEPGGPGTLVVTTLNPAGSGLIYSTYFGGYGLVSPAGIALDPNGDVFVGGQTESTNLPVTAGAFQTSNHASAGAPSPNLTGFVTSLAIGSLAIANVSLSTNVLGFGIWAIGSPTPSQEVILTNTSSTATLYFNAVMVGGANASSFLAPNSCGGSSGGSLAPGASCRISVIFNPVAAGAQSATITLTDNTASSPHTISLSGTGIAAPAASLSLSTTNLAFGNWSVGFPTPSKDVIVTNTSSTAVLYFKSISVTGANASSFAAPNTCGYAGGSLAAGASCRISVIFNPVAAGTLNATVTMIDNASASPQTINLSGTGIAAPATSLSLSTTNLAFGTWGVGFPTPSQEVFVTNTSSTAVLYFTSVLVTGANASSFRAPNTCGYAGGSLAPGASCRISVIFNPVAAGTLSATVTLIDNAATSPQTINLSGTGIAAPAATLSLSTTNIGFGSRDIGSPTPSQEVFVTNTSSTAVLYFKSVLVTGANASSFRAPNTCGYAGGSLAPGASCRISAYLNPTAAGAASATINLIDNASNSPQTITLSGTGVE